MSKVEMKFHSLIFSCLVGIIVFTSGIWVPWLQTLSLWAKVSTIVSALLLSHVGYKWVAKIALQGMRKVPFFLRLMLGNCYVNGFWVGVIKSSSGNKYASIEKYEQDLSELHMQGKSYQINGKLRASWNVSAVVINLSPATILAISQTTVFDDVGNIFRTVDGFGKLQINGDEITGYFSDVPLKILTTSGNVIEERTYHYGLKRMLDKNMKTFEDVMRTQKWKEIVEEAKR